MLLQTFSRAVVMADFYMHQQEIAEALCENKDKPQLDCEGNCQLKKELDDETKHGTVQHIQEFSPFIFYPAWHFEPVTAPDVCAHPYPLNDTRTFGYQGYVFHPPAAA